MVEPEPYLHVDAPDGEVRAVVLVLHGGQSKSRVPVRASQLAVLRMLPFVNSLRRAGRDQGLAVARLRYRVRGWNGLDQSPVPDVLTALDRLAERFPGAPAALVGHSMGGRAAVYAAGNASVRAVVGLAPWLEPGDPCAQLAGRRLVVLHGDLDRMTSPPESAAFTARAARVAVSASFVSVHGDRHPMLRRARLWHEVTSGYVVTTLCNAAPAGTFSDAATNTLKKLVAEESSIDV